MKTKLYILLLIFPLLFLQQGCDKDYPNDIPRWLKQKIKERKKECKDGGCSCSFGGTGCWRIVEWDESETIYFLIDKGFGEGDLVSVELYSKNGELLCEGLYDKTQHFSDYSGHYKEACPGLLIEGYKLHDIWKNGN